MVRQSQVKTVVKKNCALCKHSRNVEIFSHSNIFCSIWVETIPLFHSCIKFEKQFHNIK